MVSRYSKHVYHKLPGINKVLIEDSASNMMHFVLQTPSLQHLAGVKIVAHLWAQRHIFTQIPQYSLNPESIYSCRHAPQWLLINDLVESKVSALPLPEPCKNQLMHLIKPLGDEILRWCEYYKEDCRTIQLLDILLLPKLCWTMHGTVDYASTAKLIVKDERVDLQKRFEVACIYCLEDEARQLFERVVEERGEDWVPILRYDRRDHLCQLILFFTRSINLDVRGETMSFGNKYLFEATLCRGNRAMCEFLFQRLNREEQNQVLKDCKRLILSCCRSSTGTLFYLSLMNEEQQRFMFRKCISDVLLRLLHWPMQSLFVETWKRGWQLMGSFHCADVLFIITRYISQGYNDYDYSRLFWECWRLMPANYASCLLDYDDLLEGLLLTQREEFMKLILNEVSSRQMKESFDRISDVLMDEGVMSDAALMECKETAVLESSKDRDNVEKRLRMEDVGRLVDLVMERRMERRERRNE